MVITVQVQEDPGWPRSPGRKRGLGVCLVVEGLLRRPTVRASMSIGRTIPPPLFEAEQPKNLHQTKQGGGLMRVPGVYWLAAVRLAWVGCSPSPELRDGDAPRGVGYT